MAKLPSDIALLKLKAAGFKHWEIAEQYGVSRQAVTYRFNAMKIYMREKDSEVTEALPWDFSSFSESVKRKLWSDEAMLGLRSYVRQQLGAELSERGEEAMRAFLGHVARGEVLAVNEEVGSLYVPRDELKDEGLVVRWPVGVPRDSRALLLGLPQAPSKGGVGSGRETP